MIGCVEMTSGNSKGTKGDLFFYLKGEIGKTGPLSVFWALIQSDSPKFLPKGPDFFFSLHHPVPRSPRSVHKESGVEGSFYPVLAGQQRWEK